MELKIPLRNNKTLRSLVDRINSDRELFQIWKCANVNAVDRSGISDHGEVHIQIVANAALRIVRLLVKGGVEPSVVTHHGLTNEDAELIVVLAACLHDTGIAVHRICYWRKKLAARKPQRSVVTARGFVPVRVVEDLAESAASAPPWVEAALPGGVQLQFHGTWSQTELQPWIAALGASNAE